MTQTTNSTEPAPLQEPVPAYLSREPTHVRFWVVGAMTLAAFLMYLDRLCMSQIVNTESFRREFNFDDGTVGIVLGAFFFAYAVGQVPGGWLSDRFGSRVLMTIFIALWSAFTLFTGLAVGFWTLLLARVGCGLAEAGAYPASSGLVSRWIPGRARGLASGVVAGGGRLGGALAPMLTAVVIASFGQWRSAGWMFGAAGVIFAWLFWRIVRDRPVDHPHVNPVELAHIADGLPPEQAQVRRRPRAFPFIGLVTNTSMWWMCAHQFLANLGWAFLATLMPKFLKQAKGLSDEVSGSMSTVALLIGMLGMLFGGWLTDSLTRRFGQRKGRIVPLAWSRFIAAGAYLICVADVNAWVCVAAFALVAMMSDVAVPATWAYCQDVGGRNVAAVLAWPNMWGNIGAAFTASLLTFVNKNFDANGDWHESLMVCAGMFILCGLTAFGVRADSKIAGTSGDDEEPAGFPVVLPSTAAPVAPREG